ncbi:MAG: c-type cytochrome [Lentisphaeraceae bacterium]|nr:c-type cytochrome [Lentisphaeraceae bacterium]
MNIYRSILLLLFFSTLSTDAIDDPAIAVYRDTCSACHLDTGFGNPSLKVPSIAGLPRWYVTDQLRKFRFGERGDHKKDTAGQLMRQNTKSLDDRVIAFLGRYVAKLKPIDRKATLKKTNVESGKVIYAKHCVKCHSPNGAGSKSKRVPPLNLQPDWYLLEQLIKFENGQRQHAKEFRLNAWGKEAKDIAAYINTLKSKEETE